jgi:3-hydroxyacyl-[acyl-carrier-protein] dehydratase
MHSETTLRIAPDHPAFAGHFPGAPILPGVVLLDAAVHALQKMLRAATPDDGHDGPMGATCQIGSAKFLSPVQPGETLTISIDTVGAGSARFEISSGGRKVATGTLVLPPAP